MMTCKGFSFFRDAETNLYVFKQPVDERCYASGQRVKMEYFDYIFKMEPRHRASPRRFKVSVTTMLWVEEDAS